MMNYPTKEPYLEASMSISGHKYLKYSNLFLIYPPPPPPPPTPYFTQCYIAREDI